MAKSELSRSPRININGGDTVKKKLNIEPSEATINLLDAGCTNSQAKAITGHCTDQMVNHYAKKVNQRRQACEAMNKIVQFDKAARENG